MFDEQVERDVCDFFANSVARNTAQA